MNEQDAIAERKRRNAELGNANDTTHYWIETQLPDGSWQLERHPQSKSARRGGWFSALIDGISEAIIWRG